MSVIKYPEMTKDIGTPKLALYTDLGIKGDRISPITAIVLEQSFPMI